MLGVVEGGSGRMLYGIERIERRRWKAAQWRGKFQIKMKQGDDSEAQIRNRPQMI